MRDLHDVTTSLDFNTRRHFKYNQLLLFLLYAPTSRPSLAWVSPKGLFTLSARHIITLPCQVAPLWRVRAANPTTNSLTPLLPSVVVTTVTTEEGGPRACNSTEDVSWSRAHYTTHQAPPCPSQPRDNGLYDSSANNSRSSNTNTNHHLCPRCLSPATSRFTTGYAPTVAPT